MTITLDDYYGNIVTLCPCFSNNYTIASEWVPMYSNNKHISAELEITVWETFIELETFIIPTLTEYHEYFENEKELCDWVRSLSYQYGIAFIEEVQHYA